MLHAPVITESKTCPFKLMIHKGNTNSDYNQSTKSHKHVISPNFTNQSFLRSW